MNKLTVSSRNGIFIRLTKERWEHIILMHPNLANRQEKVLITVNKPDFMFKGKKKELLAVSKISQRSFLVVVYKEALILRTKESTNDGFIITAFDTTDTTWLFKKELIWSRYS